MELMGGRVGVVCLQYASRRLCSIPRPIAKAVAMWLYASTFALCIVLLSINDGPFRTGGYTLGPTLLKQLSED